MMAEERQEAEEKASRAQAKKEKERGRGRPKAEGREGREIPPWMYCRRALQRRDPGGICTRIYSKPKEYAGII